MTILNSDPEQELDPNSLEAWLNQCRKREAEFQQWLEQQDIERREREEQDYEARRTEQERRDRERQHENERRLNEQRQQDEQRRRNDERRKQSRAEADRPQKVQEIDRGNYARPRQKPEGLSRHDRYNIDTAHELEAAADRARSQGIDPTNEKQFQRFLNDETQQGIHQPEGKRPLSERYQELRDRRDQAITLIERGASPDQIPELSLRESDWEQQHRIAHQREIRQGDRFQSTARDRLAQIRNDRATAEIQPTPAREKLAQTRAEHGIEAREPSARSKSKQR